MGHRTGPTGQFESSEPPPGCEETSAASSADNVSPSQRTIANWKTGA